MIVKDFEIQTRDGLFITRQGIYTLLVDSDITQVNDGNWFTIVPTSRVSVITGLLEVDPEVEA